MRNIQPPPTPLPRSYADVAKHNQIQTDETTATLAQLVAEFKNLIQQLFQQNTMVLNLLTTLVIQSK
jgi:hypothetical protein